MEAGKLDRRVQFRRGAVSDDGFSASAAWADHGADVWASKADVSDGERWRAGQVGAQITTRFVVRWSAFTDGLTPKDRLTCEGRAYEIVGLKEVGRRQMVEITAKADDA